MRKNVMTGVSLFALSAGMAQAGGFELQSLDTSMMYADGNQASISYASIDAFVQGENILSAASKKQVVKDQTVTNLAGKFDVGDSLSIGFSTFRSGAVQLSGGNGSAANLTPIADIKLETTALLLNYQLNDNLSLMGGMTNNSLKDSTVQTLAGSYTIPGATEQGYNISVTT